MHRALETLSHLLGLQIREPHRGVSEAPKTSKLPGDDGPASAAATEGPTTYLIDT
jgi:hypothetical protein